MLLLIDNYDSFTYNLAQYFGELGEEVKVVRNDALTIDEITHLNPSRICISPGPGSPDRAGISIDVIKRFSNHIPILGVCLGHQAIGAVFGGRVIHAKQVMHGKVSRITHNNHGVFHHLANPLTVTRYHSLAIDRESLPECLEITAIAEDGEIMGISHKTLPVQGVQFHPEALLSEQGHELLQNFLIA